MTESEWQGCSDPALLWGFIYPPGCDDGDYPSMRKVRLFACACWRRVWGALTQRASRRAAEVAEQYADITGPLRRYREVILRKRDRAEVEARAAADALLASIPLEPELEELLGQAGAEADRLALRRSLATEEDLARSGLRAAEGVIDALERWSWCPYQGKVAELGEAPAREAADAAAERIAHCSLLRCVFGHMIWQGPFDRDTLPVAIEELARAAYEDRQLPGGHLVRARLLVLADALEEAGCAAEAILAHLRGPGPHVRGCWCLDLLLGNG
jgi:hypothetical protein